MKMNRKEAIEQIDQLLHPNRNIKWDKGVNIGEVKIFLVKDRDAIEVLKQSAKQVEEVRSWLIGKIKELKPLRNIDTESGILCSCYETLCDMLTEEE